VKVIPPLSGDIRLVSKASQRAGSGSNTEKNGGDDESHLYGFEVRHDVLVGVMFRWQDQPVL